MDIRDILDIFPPYFHGTLREHYLILFGAAGAIALAVGSMSAWLGAHFGARRGARRALREALAARAELADARLEQLAQAVDAIALDLERISEAQRFAAKLLAERVPAAVAAPAAAPAAHREPGAITPH